MSILLSPRLARIAAYVLPGETVADVGTDHAYIPIWLLQTGVSARAFATDLRPGPLQNARRDAEKAGVAGALTLYLCDGLALCPPEEIDTVILAGMGGETMAGILDAAPWAKEKRLILQPQTRTAELRRYLAQNGLAVLDAALVRDAGRVYLIWLAGRGCMETGSVDPVLLRKRDPLLKAYTDALLRRRGRQLAGLERAKIPDAARIGALRGEIEELKRINREAAQWR